MNDYINTTATTVLTAAQLFRIIKSFPRVWFSLISSNPCVRYEFFVPSEEVFLDFENGVPTICAGLDIEKDSSTSISCDTYQCQVDFEDNDIISLNAKPLTNGDSSCPNISIYVTQWL